jgi:hypothetical protein
MRALIALFAIALFALPVAGHELAVYTVVVNSEGAYPTDVPKDSLKEGDAIWFWMKDSTEGASLIVELEKGGTSYPSPELTYSCELDENGEKVNEDCQNRFEFIFNQYKAAGMWDVTYHIYMNGTINSTIEGSVYINADSHNDDHSSFSHYIRPVAGIAAVFSLLAMVMLLMTPSQEQHEEE